MNRIVYFEMDHGDFIDRVLQELPAMPRDTDSECPYVDNDVFGWVYVPLKIMMARDKNGYIYNGPCGFPGGEIDIPWARMEIEYGNVTTDESRFATGWWCYLIVPKFTGLTRLAAVYKYLGGYETVHLDDVEKTMYVVNRGQPDHFIAT